MSASPPPHHAGPVPPPGAEHDGTLPGDRTLHIRGTRLPLRRAVDVVARLGTAVTLASLLVVTAAALTAVDAAPTPAGVTTAER